MTTEEQTSWEIKWDLTLNKIKNLMNQDDESCKDSMKQQESMD